jgi:PilZ domain-containing protein
MGRGTTMKARHFDKYVVREFASPDHVNTTLSKNASANLDGREAERVPFYCHVSYASDAEECRGEGQLLNLSKTGCRIVGSVLAVGSTATLSLDLDDGKAPLDLTGVTVCWNDGYSFGVKFPPMTAVNRQRVQELILKFATLRGASQDHTAFRLA